MDKEQDNYLASITEHTDTCIHKLDELAGKLHTSGLTENDFYAVERLLQVLIEAGIGFAKQWLKRQGQTVRVNAYDNFQGLHDLNLIDDKDLALWKSMIGLRNVLVHDYLNIDRNIIQAVLKKDSYKIVARFIQHGAKNWIVQKKKTP